MHKDILSENDRKVICEFLAENATDDALLRAVEDTKDRRRMIQTDFDSIRSYIGAGRFFPSPGVTKIPEKTVSELQETLKQLPKGQAPVEKIEPPGTAAKRIGGETLSHIKRLLTQKPLTADVVNRHLNRTLPETQAVLKLLWQRGSVSYNSKQEYSWNVEAT